MRIGYLPTTCPRCGDPTQGQHGALSRTDNETIVCDSCGTQEALEEHYFGAPVPKVLWQSNTRMFTVDSMKFQGGE
jgi:predicted RNA-binding Zn-ribbon protein involved in translation (DUF1610 family)